MTDIQPIPDAASLETRIRAWTQTQVSPGRFAHIEGVVATADALGHQHMPAAVPALRLAGWIHDAAKERPDDELIALAEAGGYPVRPVERAFPVLLHGAAAITLTREQFGLDDPVVIAAVLAHTTGRAGMTLPDKLFYLADLIEPSRTYGWIDQVRVLVQQDVDQALLFAVTYQLRRLLKHGAVIDPRALEMRNDLLLAGVPLATRKGAGS